MNRAVGFAILFICSAFDHYKPKEIANNTKTLWERICLKKPKIVASILLFVFYLCTLIIGIFFFMLILYATAYQTKTDTVINSNGNKVLKSSTYFFGTLIKEIDVTSNGVYNGEAVYYSKGKKIQSGKWYLGKKEGVWVDYDKNGIIITQSYYKNGDFIYSEEPEKEKTSWPMPQQAIFSQPTNYNKTEIKTAE